MSDRTGPDGQYATLSLAGSQNLCQTKMPFKAFTHGLQPGMMKITYLSYGKALSHVDHMLLSFFRLLHVGIKNHKHKKEPPFHNDQNSVHDLPVTLHKTL